MFDLTLLLFITGVPGSRELTLPELLSLLSLENIRLADPKKEAYLGSLMISQLEIQ